MPENGRGSDAPQGSQAPESFEAFAQASQRRLYRTAYLLCGDPDTARDLTQTTLAKLFQHWPRASVADHIEAYAALGCETAHGRTRRAGRPLGTHPSPGPGLSGPLVPSAPRGVDVGLAQLGAQLCQGA